MALTHTCRTALSTGSLLLFMAVPTMAWGQTLQPQSPASNQAVATSSSDNSYNDAQNDLDSCRIHRVTSLPGSHQFASDFIEAIASDPDPAAYDPDLIWGLTADLSSAAQLEAGSTVSLTR